MKRVLAIITGIVTGFIIVFIGDATVHALYAPPKGVDYNNREAMRELMNAVPMYVLIVMLLFWLGSAFLGAMLAARINRVAWKQTALITGSILMAAALLNMALVPHPAWMWIVVLAGYIPVALLGGWLVRPKLPDGISRL